MSHRLPNTRVRAIAAFAFAALAFTLAALAAAPSAPAATCGTQTGGVSTSSCGFTGTKARLVDGRAIPPKNAPYRVKQVIWAANRIRNKPYKWGGGHSRWWDSGYDCSGAVSYALRGGRFVSSPMPSSGYMRWAKRGYGRWITVFANGGHVYAVIAGLRWDTSMTPGNGPGWSKQMRSPAGFRIRHPARF